LIELGHTKIAYIGNSLSGRTTLDRLTGFRQEMDAAGLVVPDKFLLEVPGSGPEHGSAVVDAFLSMTDRPTALVCYNDMLAIGVLKRLQQIGVRVPQDVSVAGFDNIIFSAYTNPPLTTFDQPKRFIGAEAARLLMELLDKPSDQGLSTQQNVKIIKGQLLARESTARPPG
jgi:DNA-binding LacI/PurR family transcriptional regulator